MRLPIPNEVKAVSKDASGSSTMNCFHCGLPIPKQSDYQSVIAGQTQRFCCRGCQAVAKAIDSAGLGDFYRYRTQPASRPAELPDVSSETVYDHPAIQKTFVRPINEQEREATLILEGIVCAACVWLNERHVSELPGVVAFHINYATHRGVVRWDNRCISLSHILEAIRAIGYRAYPFDPSKEQMIREQERDTALRRLAVAAACAMQVMTLAIALYLGDAVMTQSIRDLLRWISLISTLPVMGYAAVPFFTAAGRDVMIGRWGMDVPVALALIGAFVASMVHTIVGEGAIYFDSVAMFTLLLLGSRFLEMNARRQATYWMDTTARRVPTLATRLTAVGTEETVAVADLKVGDVVQVAPGHPIPADGIVTDGQSHVDEAWLTGESHSIEKTIGDQVIGGSLNQESRLLVRIEKVGADTLLASLIRLVEQAGQQKPIIAQQADRIARVFIASLLLAVLLVGIGWWWYNAVYVIPVTLAMLVITCPCALSLATPTALTAATSRLMQKGFLIQRGHALETLAQVTHVIFDKTGTLTYGQMRIAAIQTFGRYDEKHCMALAKSLEKGSEHPIAKAFHHDSGDILCYPVTAIRNYPGQGVEGWIDGQRIRVGQADFVAVLYQEKALNERSQDDVVSNELNTTHDITHDITLVRGQRVYLGDEKGLLARFSLTDKLRPDAQKTIEALSRMGLQVHLLSGDHPDQVAHIACQIGIRRAVGGLLPQAKWEYVRALQAQGAVVAMVGDGINDAPVLAAAPVSLALASGTPLAQATADIVVLGESLDGVVEGIKTARQTQAIIRQNLIWSMIYNVIAIPLAAGGWVAPWLAAIGMSASSLFVVANSLRLAPPNSAYSAAPLRP